MGSPYKQNGLKLKFSKIKTIGNVIEWYFIKKSISIIEQESFDYFTKIKLKNENKTKNIKIFTFFHILIKHQISLFDGQLLVILENWWTLFQWSVLKYKL